MTCSGSSWRVVSLGGTGSVTFFGALRRLCTFCQSDDVAGLDADVVPFLVTLRGDSTLRGVALVGHLSAVGSGGGSLLSSRCSSWSKIVDSLFVRDVTGVLAVGCARASAMSLMEATILSAGVAIGMRKLVGNHVSVSALRSRCVSHIHVL